MSEERDQWLAVKQLFKNGVQTTSDVGVTLDIGDIKLVVINAIIGIYADKNNSYIQYNLATFRNKSIPITTSVEFTISEKEPCYIKDIIVSATSEENLDKALSIIKKSIEERYSNF